MKKVELYYRNCHLGTLTYENGKYVYNSDLLGEKLYEQECPLKYEYKLRNSKNLESDYLFDEFSVFEKLTARADAVMIGGIKPTDDMFTKLHKVAGINSDKISYYIRQS